MPTNRAVTLIKWSVCSELCKDFYVVYQLEMVAGEVESSCQLVVTFFFFWVSPDQTIEISLGQLSGAPPLISTLLPPSLIKTHDSVSCGPRSRRATP